MKDANRSGKLLATNDEWIERLMLDPHYIIERDGTVWVDRDLRGHQRESFRKVHMTDSKDYPTFKYKRHMVRLSRVLYRAFCGPLEQDKVINHIDGNTHNNQIENLELVTQSENNIHRFQVMKTGPVRGACKLTDVEVSDLRDLQSQGWTNRQLREKFNLAKSTISYIVNRRTYVSLESHSETLSSKRLDQPL